jgi:hypothetical protein
MGGASRRCRYNDRLSPEILLMMSPHETYARLARARSRGTILTAVRRPALIALVFGVAMAMASTRRVTPELLFSTTLCWLFVVVLQAAIAVPLIAAPARRTVGLTRGFDLYFAGHAPWSLWLLAAAAWGPSPVGRPLWPIFVVAAAALILTARIVAAFFREVLELDPRHALVRAAAQQAVTWLVFVALYGTAVALAPRVLEWFA